MSPLNLSDNEKETLEKLEKDSKGLPPRYIVGSILIFIGIAYPFFMQDSNESQFYKSIFFVAVGSSLIAVHYSYKKIYLIISKMKDYIKELEKANNAK